MEKCLLYKQGKAQHRKYLGKDVVFCSISPENCPYGNGEEFKSHEGLAGTICKSEALLEKKTLTSPKFGIEIEPQFDLTKVIKIPYELK